MVFLTLRLYTHLKYVGSKVYIPGLLAISGDALQNCPLQISLNSISPVLIRVS